MDGTPRGFPCRENDYLKHSKAAEILRQRVAHQCWSETQILLMFPNLGDTILAGIQMHNGDMDTDTKV